MLSHIYARQSVAPMIIYYIGIIVIGRCVQGRSVWCKRETHANGADPVQKITFIFVAGIEGTGHHGFTPLLTGLPGVLCIPGLEKSLMTLWDPTTSLQLRNDLRKDIPQEIQQRLQACNIAKGPGNCSTVLVGRVRYLSFPFSNPRNAVRKPDLLELIDIIENAQVPGYQWDLKILVLHRHPRETTLSTLRRGFVSNQNCIKQVPRGHDSDGPNGTCNPLLYLSKEAEMELTFLNAEVTTLSAQYFRVINYTNLMNQPETYARPISRFLRLSHQSEDHLTTRLRTGITKNHTSRPTPPDTSLDFLDDFLPSDEINSGAFLVGMRSTLRLSID